MELKRISQKEFDRMKLCFEDLTYEKLLQLWGISNFLDSDIAEKCGVPGNKIAKLRHDYDIKQQNIDYHAGLLSQRKLSLQDEADAILAYVFKGKKMDENMAEASRRMQKLILLKQSVFQDRYWAVLGR